MIKIKFKKLSENAIIPTKGRAGDACFDLYAAEDVVVVEWQTSLVKTNIAMEIPEGYFGKIYTRSGMALRGWEITGGILDSNYRGDVGILIRHIYTGWYVESRNEHHIQKGDRIAQLAIHKVEDVEFEEAEELSDTIRGEQGYGSSGV